LAFWHSSFCNRAIDESKNPKLSRFYASLSFGYIAYNANSPSGILIGILIVRGIPPRFPQTEEMLTPASHL
jgi:hypothetical protein